MKYPCVVGLILGAQVWFSSYGVSVPEEPATPTTNEEEALPDFSSVRDPFVSQLPKHQKVERPVEPTVQNVHNEQKLTMGQPTAAAFADNKEDLKLPPLEIQGIIWGGKYPQAIINENVLEVGDSVDKVKILAIRKNGIQILYEGRKFEVSVDP